MWNSLALAVQLLTRLPPLSLQMPSRLEARRAVALFPLIGALVGLLQAAVWVLASHVWHGEPLIPAILAVAVGALLTGGALPAGIGRTADALASLTALSDKSRAQAILRDPRRGTSGTIAISLFLVLEIGFLAALPPLSVLPSLMLAAALGRWGTAFAYSAFPAVSVSGDLETGRGLADAGPPEFLLATIVVFIVAAWLPLRGLLTMMAVVVLVGPLAQWGVRMLGGVSRPICDALGALAELVALAALTVHS
jgi:adenosylcobinamide-GDP ribazoletransferase